MRDINRVDRVLDKLSTLWKRFPDLRFWQLIQMLEIPEHMRGSDPFFWEDDKWEEIIQNTLDKYSR